jgi:hypothetical protein
MMSHNRSPKLRTCVVLCGAIGLASVVASPATAQWKATADFSACPSQYVPQRYGEDHFSNQQQCQAAIGQAKASLACGRYQCLAEGSGQTGDAGGGDLVNQSTQALVKGFMNNNPQEMSLGLFGLGMNSLIQGMQGDPNEEARQAQIAAQQRQAAAAEAQRRAAEAARQAAEIKSQLLPGVGGADPLPTAPIVTAGNDIKLLTSDELLGGTGTKFFGGSNNNGCAPSQDASVVDLCGINDPNAGKTNVAALPPEANSGPPQASLMVPNDYPGAPVINGLLTAADGLNWDPEKKKRLAASLTSLELPSDFVPPSGDADDTWAAVKARGADLELARQASLAPGPELFSVGAGQQKNGTDCTIFALANAASLPYGVVASRAGELLKQASWRNADDRANPEQAIYKRGGLNGGEVIFLAEAFGQARVVTPGDFAKTVQGGQPVMFNKDGHEMVLAKTFQHDGQTWYEVMDSNQGPIKRLYMSAPELNTVISENGVAYSANPGTTAKLLR